MIGMARTMTDNKTQEELSEQRQAILMHNTLVAGDIEVANKILEAADFKVYPCGTQIIEQGASDDCVYFILSGSVEIIINDVHAAYQSVPSTVGELAAKKAGAPRTADVFVQSNELEALVLSGTDFRKLMREHPCFSNNLNSLVEAYARERMAGHGQKSDEPSWMLISVASSAVFALMSFAAWFWIGLTGLSAVFASLFSGMALFIALQFLNPALRYRNACTAAVFGIIVLAAYSATSFVVTVAGKAENFPIFINFRGGASTDPAGLVIPFIALFATAWLMAHYDIKFRNSGRR